MSGGMLAVEQRLQAVRNEHDKLISDVEKLRRDNEEAFAHQLESMVSCRFAAVLDLGKANEYRLHADKDYITTRISEMVAEVA